MIGDSKPPFGGRYLLEREIGAGRAARVFLAQDGEHDRRVVVKILGAEQSQRRDHIRREIGLAAHLTHPHILSVLDWGEFDGRLFIVMPHAEAGSLRDLLNRRSPLRWDETLSIGDALAAGLDFAHRHGAAHGNLTPNNVLMVDDMPMIADFGIEPVPVNEPESDVGDLTAGRHRDIHGLASIVFEMLAGQPPTADRADALPATWLSELRPDLPQTTIDAVAAGLASVPADRPSTARGFLAALRRSNVLPPRAGASFPSSISDPWAFDERSRSVADADPEEPIAGLSSAPRSYGVTSRRQWIAAVLLVFLTGAYFLAKRSPPPDPNTRGLAGAPEPTPVVLSRTSSAQPLDHLDNLFLRLVEGEADAASIRDTALAYWNLSDLDSAGRAMAAYVVANAVAEPGDLEAGQRWALRAVDLRPRERAYVRLAEDLGRLWPVPTRDQAENQCTYYDPGSYNPDGSCFDSAPSPLTVQLVPLPSEIKGRPSPVTLAVEIQPDGFVERVLIVRSSNDSYFTGLAIRHVRNEMRYSPAQKDGEPVVAWRVDLFFPGQRRN